MPAEKLLIVRVANSYNVSVKRHISSGDMPALLALPRDATKLARRIDDHGGYTQLARYTESVRFAAMRNAGYLRGDEGRGAHATGIREEMLEFFGRAEPIAMPESLAVPASVSILAAQAQTFALVGLNALVQATAPFVEFLPACPGRAHIDQSLVQCPTAVDFTFIQPRLPGESGQRREHARLREACTARR